MTHRFRGLESLVVEILWDGGRSGNMVSSIFIHILEAERERENRKWSKAVSPQHSTDLQ